MHELSFHRYVNTIYSNIVLFAKQTYVLGLICFSFTVTFIAFSTFLDWMFIPEYPWESLIVGMIVSGIILHDVPFTQRFIQNLSSANGREKGASYEYNHKDKAKGQHLKFSRKKKRSLPRKVRKK